MGRVIFKSKRARQEFFEKLLKESSLKTWKHFYESHKIPRSVLDNYKSGRLSIPSNTYEQFSLYFNNHQKENFSKRIKLLLDNWGKVKGGKKTYLRHKEVFEKGRKKGILKIQEKRKKSAINFDKAYLDKDLSYFVGLLIGDGFINRYGRHYLIQFVGHKESELDYYNNIICTYVKEKFSIIPIVKESKIGNFIRVNIYSKDLFEFLIKRVNFPKGRKSHTVLIPPKILASEKSILLSCIAGIYDAEGCIFFDKRKAYHKPYPRLDLHMLNIGILNQIKKILEKEGIVCNIFSASSDNSRLLIYGENNIKEFLGKIPIKNPKHTNKLKEYGFL